MNCRTIRNLPSLVFNYGCVKITKWCTVFPENVIVFLQAKICAGLKKTRKFNAVLETAYHINVPSAI